MREIFLEQINNGQSCPPADNFKSLKSKIEFQYTFDNAKDDSMWACRHAEIDSLIDEKIKELS